MSMQFWHIIVVFSIKTINNPTEISLRISQQRRCWAGTRKRFSHRKKWFIFKRETFGNFAAKKHGGLQTACARDLKIITADCFLNFYDPKKDNNKTYRGIGSCPK